MKIVGVFLRIILIKSMTTCIFNFVNPTKKIQMEKKKKKKKKIKYIGSLLIIYKKIVYEILQT
jgi:hypothetical protein